MASAAVESPGRAYEDLRKRQVEENKKKMALLKIDALAESLLQGSNRAAKSSPAKQVKRKIRQEGEESEPTLLRRSIRVAKLPAADYREAAALIDEEGRSKRFCRLYKQRRDLSGRIYASDEARMYAYNKAEEVQGGLENKFPSFVKPMTQSHVTGGFWLELGTNKLIGTAYKHRGLYCMESSPQRVAYLSTASAKEVHSQLGHPSLQGLPTTFCRKHLPKRDETMQLLDEDGESYDTLFLARKSGLSAGWRGFSIAHELVDGDALVFQLVNPTTFKVFIFRASSYTEKEESV